LWIPTQCLFVCLLLDIVIKSFIFGDGMEEKSFRKNDLQYLSIIIFFSSHETSQKFHITCRNLNFQNSSINCIFRGTSKINWCNLLVFWNRGLEALIYRGTTAMYDCTGGPPYSRSWYSRFWLFADSKTANNEGNCHFEAKLA